MSKPHNTNRSNNGEEPTLPGRTSGITRDGVEWTVFNGDAREVLKQLVDEAYNKEGHRLLRMNFDGKVWSKRLDYPQGGPPP